MKANLLSITSSSEEDEGLWVVCGVYTESWSYAFGVHWNITCIRKMKFQSFKFMFWLSFRFWKVHAEKVPTCKDKKQCNLWILQLEINFLYKSFVCDIIMIES